MRILPNCRRKSGFLHSLKHNSMRRLSNLRNPTNNLRLKYPSRPTLKASINIGHNLRLRISKSEQMGYSIINSGIYVEQIFIKDMTMSK